MMDISAICQHTGDYNCTTMVNLTHLRDQDPEVFRAICAETHRQQQNLELIASENFASIAVLEAQGSVLTNKYAEGYPDSRYYGGCKEVDVAERLAVERAKQLFRAEHVNVQPHSGSQANMAVYFAILDPGDTIMAMDVAHGGHLTHGHKANFSGRLYNVISYGVDRETERLDVDAVRTLAHQQNPDLLVAGASAYPRIIDFARLAEIAREMDIPFLVDMAHIAGLVATGLHPSPIPSADFVTTTTHKTLRGPRGGMIFCRSEYAKAVDSQVFPGIQGGPLMHVIAAKAVALGEALRPEFRRYQEQVVANARTLAEALTTLGHRLVSGGTDTHLLLVDVSPLGLTGKEAEDALYAAGMTVNKNLIPFDTQPPSRASGIRLGTPAVTTRGMAEAEMCRIAEWVDAVLRHPEDGSRHRACAQDVAALCAHFPLYSDLMARIQ
jgi:glycine hydroxymethyltransferase